MFIEPLEPRRLMASGLPQPAHVVVVVEENRSYRNIFGPGVSAPFLKRIARFGARFNHARNVADGSLPNYLALFSGSTQGAGADDDITTKFSGRSLGRQLIDSGNSFAGYSEDLPSTGFEGQSSGDYV